ncbi:thioredoxin domain-containing protein [Demequina sp.]|uniref:thioredoxin domain-containing protein n=1 Tax=Demequina sp. TaxID=2050685 RepID=UPI0025BA3EAB|nr:thioredoxin domain-containing protein [Demequina sp.]
MNTLHDALRQHVAATEIDLAAIERPSLRQRAHRRRVVRRATIASAATVSTGALALGVAWTIPAFWPYSTAAIGDAATAGHQGLPLGEDGSVLVSVPAETVVVDVYLDPICPACADFGASIEPQLRAIDGATVVIHPIAFFDSLSSDGSYSTRAGSAIHEVAAGSPQHVGAFLHLLWQHQPAEGSTLTDEQLGDLAASIGVPHDVVARFPEHRYADAIATATDAATAAGVAATPAVYADGTGYFADSWQDVVDPIREVARGKAMDIDAAIASVNAERESREAAASPAP